MTGWLSNRTLDEVAWLDTDQVEQALKHSKLHGPFSSNKEVNNFVFRAMDACLEKMGVKIHPGMDPKMADRILGTKKVKIETRRYPKPEEEFRSGIYIYKGSLSDGTLELAYWISLAHKATHRLMIEPRYWIRTNAPI